MAIDEYLESEVAVAVVATAVALTPRARRVLRRGAVYGLAGALRAGDAIASFGQATARGAQEATASAAPTPTNAPSQPARRVLRRGVVFGLAGALRAGDAIASFSQATARGAHEAAASAASPNQSADTQGQGGET